MKTNKIRMSTKLLKLTVVTLTVNIIIQNFKEISSQMSKCTSTFQVCCFFFVLFMFDCPHPLSSKRNHKSELVSLGCLVTLQSYMKVKVIQARIRLWWLSSYQVWNRLANAQTQANLKDTFRKSLVRFSPFNINHVTWNWSQLPKSNRL